MKDIVESETFLRPVSNDQFKIIQNRLMSNMNQISFFRENQFEIIENKILDQDYTGENLRRSYYKNSKFITAKLKNTGFSGSYFQSTNFVDSIIYNTKLDFCEFDNCKFYNLKNIDLKKYIKFCYANFNQSRFLNSFFINLDLEAANFTEIIFENVIFNDCIWRSLCLEGATFRNTILDNVVLHKLNFEFSIFDNIKMNNVRLPFPTIPFIFNGLSYLMTTSDSITISSASSKTGTITIKEYLDCLSDLIAFYTTTENYFPLANILISLCRYEEAYIAILKGIEYCMQFLRNFRHVYYFCKLLQLTPYFSFKQRADVFNIIINFSNLNEWRPLDYYNFSFYIDRIRNTLLNENNGNNLFLNLNTDIKCDEYDKISMLYKCVDNIVLNIQNETGKKIIHFCEIRHNSPINFFVKFFSDYNNLNLLITSLSFVFSIKTAIDNQKFQDAEIDQLKSINNYISDMANDGNNEKEEIERLSNTITELQKNKADILAENQQLISDNIRLQKELNKWKEKLKNNNVVINTDNSSVYIMNNSIK